MAWCDHCKKNGLRKADVEFCDNVGKVLCHGCYVLAHPGWMPPREIIDLTDPSYEKPKVGFAFQLSDVDGLRARISYGEMSFSIHAPIEDIHKLVG